MAIPILRYVLIIQNNLTPENTNKMLLNNFIKNIALVIEVYLNFVYVYLFQVSSAMTCSRVSQTVSSSTRNANDYIYLETMTFQKIKRKPTAKPLQRRADTLTEDD